LGVFSLLMQPDEMAQPIRMLFSAAAGLHECHI